MSSVTLGTLVQPGDTGKVEEGAEDIDERDFHLKQLDIQRSEQQRRRRKSQWTVICVACGFFTSCLVLVAGMLSVTSDYQVSNLFLSRNSNSRPMDLLVISADLF